MEIHKENVIKNKKIPCNSRLKHGKRSLYNSPSRHEFVKSLVQGRTNKLSAFNLKPLPLLKKTPFRETLERSENEL